MVTHDASVRLFAMLTTLLAASLAVATPTMRLGANVSASGDHVYVSWTDTLGETVRITYQDPHWSPGIEAVYGPVGWLYGRVELAELRFFQAGGGALAFFPNAGLDVFVEPPFRWRLLPYLWGGMQWTGYWGSQGTPDPRFYGTPVYELRAGLGLRYGLSSHLCLFAETQMLTNLSVLSYSPIRGSPPGYLFEAIGIHSAALGVRYDFGAK